MKLNNLCPLPEIEKVFAFYSIKGVSGYSCDCDPDLACATKINNNKNSIVICRPLLKKLDELDFEWTVLHELSHINNKDIDCNYDNLPDEIKFQKEVDADRTASKMQYEKRKKNYGIYTLQKMIWVLGDFNIAHFLNNNEYLSRKLGLEKRMNILRSYKDIYSPDIGINI